jgi:hypothetical protein
MNSKKVVSQESIMPDKVVLTINVTPEQRQRIEALAQERGYPSPDDYLLALVELDAEDEDELTKEELLANLRQGLDEALRGEVYPIETLWDDLDVA